MIKVELAIGSLLFDHDCVVIPSFGGLLANYVGAEIHPITNALRPPRKKIAFNESLRQNDGLLQNFLVCEEGFSREEALVAINEFVQHINQEITTNGVFQLKGTGNFIRNEENKIQFQPSDEVNFLDDSFGLPELYYKPIQREQEEMAQVQPTQGRPVRRAPKKQPTSKEVTKTENKKSGKGIFIIIPSVLVVLGLSIFLFTKNVDTQTQEAGLVSDSTESIDQASVVEENEEVTDEYSEEIVEEHEEVVSDEMQFYIIAGVFTSEENAHKFTVLYQDGQIIHDGEYYRVYLQKFPTKDDARNHLADYRVNYGENLWILEHK